MSKTLLEEETSSSRSLDALISNVGGRNTHVEFPMSPIVAIDAFQSVVALNTISPLDCFLLDIDLGVQQIDRPRLGFLDQEKIDGIAKSKLPLVIAVIITIQALAELLVHNRTLATSFTKMH